MPSPRSAEREAARKALEEEVRKHLAQRWDRVVSVNLQNLLKADVADFAEARELAVMEEMAAKICWLLPEDAGVLTCTDEDCPATPIHEAIAELKK